MAEPLEKEVPDLVAETRPAGRLRRARVAQILHAAEQVFAGKGFDGTTTSDIAVMADMPKANVHYYFGTKEKIYRAVLDNILELWLDEADYWITPDRSPRDAFSGYIHAKIASARERPEASRIYATELLRGAPHIKEYLHLSLRSRVAGLVTVINGWAAAGKIRAVDATHLLFCIWAMTQTYADFAVQIGAVLGKPALDEQVFKTAVQTITAMVINGFVLDYTRSGL
jgi:TetR/AcrR family transcriptional regulator